MWLKTKKRKYLELEAFEGSNFLYIETGLALNLDVLFHSFGLVDMSHD